MISSSRFAVILREEASRVFNEAEAHEDDLIHQAYHGGASTSASRPISGRKSDDDEVESGTDIDLGGGPIEDDDVDSTDDESRPSGAEQVETGLLKKFNDSEVVDFGLDLLGIIGGWAAAGATAGSMGLGGPAAYVLAAVPDIINSVRHAARGDKVNAAIYFLCALPVLGEVLGPVRISMKTFGTAGRASEIYNIISKIRRLITGLRSLKTAKKSIDNIKDLVKDYFPDFDVDSVERDVMVVLEGSDEEVDDLIRRSGRSEDGESTVDRSPDPKPSDVERPDYEVSTEANPLAESRRNRRISIIFESSKPSSKSSKSSSSKLSSKKQEPLPPIPTTLEFERELRDVIAAHYAGEDIEAWLTQDILGSKASPHGLSRKTGWTGDEDFYRKPAASYMAQHLATHRDPELRSIGQRVLRKMGERMGSRRFSSMGSGFGLDPDNDWDD